MTLGTSLSFTEQLEQVSSTKTPFLKEPYSGVNFFYSVDYEYDHYGCTGYQCDQDGYDDYCRDAEYENVRIEGSVNSRAVLSEIFGVRSESIPQELVDIAENELGLHEVEAYEVEVTNSYYGEEARVILSDPETVMPRLLEYFFSLGDAVDAEEILPYLRGKGFDTTGLTPVNAVKMHLKEENRGKVVDYVENASIASRKTLRIGEVKIPQLRHYEAVEARPVIAPKGVKNTVGVVVKRGNEYVLVDGYHRMKSQKSKGAKTGSFIVLA